MGHFTYYLACLVGGLSTLAFISVFVSLAVAAKMFFVSHEMMYPSVNPGSEKVREVIDWVGGMQMRTRSYWVFFGVAPVLFLLSYVIPSQEVAMAHMKVVDSLACMTGDETGYVIAGAGEQLSLKMADGTSRLCILKDMNPRAVKLGMKMRILNGKRVS